MLYLKPKPFQSLTRISDEWSKKIISPERVDRFFYIDKDYNENIRKSLDNMILYLSSIGIKNVSIIDDVSVKNSKGIIFEVCVFKTKKVSKSVSNIMSFLKHKYTYLHDCCCVGLVEDGTLDYSHLEPGILDTYSEGIIRLITPSKIANTSLQELYNYYRNYVLDSNIRPLLFSKVFKIQPEELNLKILNFLFNYMGLVDTKSLLSKKGINVEFSRKKENSLGDLYDGIF